MASARRIEIQFLGTDKSLGKTADQVQGKLGKFQQRMDKVGSAAGKVFVAGVAAAAAGAVKLGQKASDLAETQSKVNQIFGREGAAALDKYASSAAKNIGQSKQQALDAAATFGMFGKMAGKTGTDLAGFSTQMTTLASDMASFNNTSPQEAVEAIGAALRGEAEPIRRYGVLLDDATLRQQAMRMGLIKTTKEGLTPQQKVLAAQAAILKQTKDQQGDFAKTSDGLANKQRILKAQMEDLGTKVGVKVLPVMLKLSDWGLKAVDWMEKHQKLVGILGGSFLGLAGALWTISKVAKAYTAIQAALNVVMSANPIGLVVIAIAALVAGLVIAYKKSDTFRRIVDAAFKAVGKAGKWLWENALKPAFTAMVAYIKFMGGIYKWLWDHAVKPVIKFIAEGVSKLMHMWAQLVRAMSKVPGFGWLRKVADALDNGARKAQGFSKWLDNVGKKHPRPSVKLDGADRAISQAATLNRLLGDISTNKRQARPAQNLGQLLGGRRAGGGRVSAGRAYRVGEVGMETFIPDTPGRIIPHGRSRGVAGDAVEVFGYAEVDLNLDGKHVQTVLLKLKRQRGGAALGLA